MAKRLIRIKDFGVEKFIEVTEELYKEYKRFDWREEKQRQREISYGVVYSVEECEEHGMEIPSDFDLEEHVTYTDALQRLHEELNKLSEAERDLLLGKFDKSVTLETLAKKHGISTSKAYRDQKKLLILIEDKMKDFK